MSSQLFVVPKSQAQTQSVETWVQVLEVDKTFVRPPGSEQLAYTGQISVVGEKAIVHCSITTADGDPLPSSQMGDIWIDRTRRRVFYLSKSRIWTEWGGNVQGIQPIGHPLFRRYLLAWHPRRKTISWLTSSLVSKLKKSYPAAFSANINDWLSDDEPFPLTSPPPLHSSAQTPSLKSPCHDTDNELRPSANTTYSRDWKCDSCLTTQRGIEFPESSPIVTWWNGLQTVLPFAGAIAGVKDTEDEDIETVKCMATEGRDATACPAGETEPPLLVLDLPDKRDKEGRAQFFDQCRTQAARGRPVLVRNWHGDASAPHFDWSQEDTEYEFGDLSRDVVWQDAELRANDRARLRQKDGDFNSVISSSTSADKYWVQGERSRTATGKKQSTAGSDIPAESVLHVHGRLAEFLGLVNKPDACVNLLDLGSEDRNRPWFINSLCDHSKSIVQTEKRNYDGVTQGRGKNPRAVADAPTGFSRDFYALNEWKLLTSAGFLTYPHHDAGGLCTYISMKAGLKIWGIFVPKPACRSNQPLLAATHAILELDNWQAYADLYLVMLTPGSVLLVDLLLRWSYNSLEPFRIQPPGLLHLVYSPVKSIALGGHFFIFDALHLTAWSRRIEHAIGSFSTNHEHPSVERYLARIMLALDNKPGHGRCEKPLFALALMLLDVDAFAHQSSSEIERDSEWISEIEAAKKFAIQIATHALSPKSKASVARLCQLLKSAIQTSFWYELDYRMAVLPDLQHEKMDWHGAIEFLSGPD